jgi:alkyl sulfatase BDS1-like metallo-beta-lactamase superfamily hydrolase
VYARGLVEQFGITLPTEGPDALLHVGLGLFYRNPAHAPFTTGFVPPTITFGPATTLTIGGMRVDITPAPSDADDSVTLWFPELATCVHNIVWPTLFNIFAIRGDEYRDPRVLLTGIDHVRALGAEHLVATHGPPMSGAADIARRTVRYRDSIQFLWDQTVRGINKGWTTDELASRVRLPALYDDDFLTSERYGVGEHHVRQIHNGLRGWFDGDEARLFPLEPTERFGRLIAGFGGRATVREQAWAALAAADVRWALELATWLVRAEGAEADDRALLATALRTVAERTSAANIRNWCLAHARDLDGSAPMDRFRVHRFTSRQLEGATAASIVPTLRVLLDPDRAEGIDHHLAFAVEGEATAGLHVRNGVAVPTDGAGAQSTVALDRATLVGLLTGRVQWADARAAGSVAVAGDAPAVDRVVACFEVPGFQS